MQEDNDMQMNLFDVNDEYFVIDSEKLDSVHTHIYGYIVQTNGIVENENCEILELDNLSSLGAYVFVNRIGNCITILQDYNGSYGIFVCRRGEYFVISNSFFYLLEYLRLRVDFTFNEDFVHHMLVVDLSSLAYSETPVNEIEKLPREASIEIDIENKSLQITNKSYCENTVHINSKQGIDILDAWFLKWTSLFKRIKKQSNNIIVSLTGGFDSRLTFMLALKSGINLNEIKVNSFKSELHTFKEDYEIASEIAKYFNIKLNREDNLSKDNAIYSLKDTLNMSIYSALPFHKEMYWKGYRFNNKRFRVPGSGGETIRSHWDITAKAFLHDHLMLCRKFSSCASKEIAGSVERILKHAYSKVSGKYNISEKDEDFVRYFYTDTRCRTHFGIEMVGNYFTNTCDLTPLLDSDLLMLKRNIPECKDNNLLISVLLDRYCPELLKFRFEGGRFIEPKTIACAKNINKRFPLATDVEIANKSELEFGFIDYYTSRVEANSNSLISAPDKLITDIMHSKQLEKTITRRLDSSIYEFILNQKRTYYPLRECYPLLSAALVISTLDGAKAIRNSFAEQMCGYEIRQHDSSSLRIPREIEDYITARIDIKSSDKMADFEVISISDDNAIDKQPGWIMQNGMGHTIESQALHLEIRIRALTNGRVTVSLMGRDVRDNNGNRIPVWIDYSQFCYNGEIVFSGSRPAWHDSRICYEFNMIAGELITFAVEWGIHRDTRVSIAN